MSQPNIREVVMLAPATVTTSGVGNDIVLIQGWQSCTATVVTSTTSGTSPTFAVFLQRKFGQPASTDVVGASPTGTAIYDDVMSFTSITTNATKLMSTSVFGYPTGTANATTITTADWAQQDAALTAGSMRIGPLGGAWRVKYTLGGTSPSTVLAVTLQLVYST